jgi:hypothetical protein
MGWEVLVWIDVAMGRGHVAGCHEHSSAHLRSTNLRGFVGYLRTYWPRKKISTAFRKKYSNIKFHENL